MNTWQNLILVLVCAYCGSVGIALAQQTIAYPTINANGSAIDISATLTPAKGAASATKRPAIILLHTIGGWEWPVTEQYAKALSDAGFIVMEPKLFQNANSAPAVHPSLLPMVYDALKYLAARDDVDGKKVGVAGFSYGGLLSLHSAAAWAQQAYSKDPNLKFAAHAPFYPICWRYSALAQGKRKVPIVPMDAFTKWTGAPVKIFAGGRDDFDGQDPKACDEFISSIPADYQKIFSVQLYPDATHGWDQASAEFYDKIACKGNGCTNHNISNPAVTKQSIADLVSFFSATLR